MKILSFFVVLLCFISCNKGNKLEQEEVLFDVAHMLLFICNLTITLRNMRLNLYVKI